jgi:imidazolonepropionase
MNSGTQHDLLITGIAQLVTAEGAGPKRGATMRSLAVIKDAAVAITDGRFSWIGAQTDWHGTAQRTVELNGRAVVPGLVDPHTHAVWAGDRLLDFDARTSGTSYEQILASGGGIRSTVRATLAATDEELTDLAVQRLRALMRSGATVVEVKSGYGLSIEGELRLLRVIQSLASRLPIRIVPTLLLHVPPAPPEVESYLQRIEAELIPEVARQQLARAVDIFIEKEAWTAKQAERVLTCALSHGLQVKVHAEQFHSVGGLELALRLNALSVDHLEACTPDQYALFRDSVTIATVLPGVSLHLGIPRAPGRQLIDAGAAVAVGTDLNPGSSPLFSMNAALGLSVRLNGLTMQEALVAGTINAARALGLPDAGRIAVGQPADFVVLHSADWRDLIYTLGSNPVREVWAGGICVVPSAEEEDRP